MDWHDLQSNLLSEAIGIMVTVFFVDRLLVWRDRRRWKPVREVFLTQAEFICDRLWLAIEAWIASLTIHWKPGEGWEHVYSEEKKRANDNVILDLFQFFRHRGVSKKRLTQYAAKLREAMNQPFFPRPLAKHQSWERFRDRAYPLGKELNDLIAIYGNFLEPELALIVIQVSRSLAVIEMVEKNWEAWSETQDKRRREASAIRSFHRSFEALVANALAYGILQVRLLDAYIARHRTTSHDSFVVDPSDVVP